MKAKGEEGERLKKKKKSGGRVLDLRKFCVFGEKRKERREEKKKKKETEERVKETEVLRDFLVVEGVVSCSLILAQLVCQLIHVQLVLLE